jgi:hypothetical protein
MGSAESTRVVVETREKCDASESEKGVRVFGDDGGC